MHVRFADCKRELVEEADGASKAYRHWRARPGYAEVVNFVEGFTHEYLYRIIPEQIEDVKARSKHALGDVRKEEQLPEVEDFTCPFAFQHLFHRYVEEEYSLPTWQEFRAWMNGPAARFFTEPLLESTGWHGANSQRRRQLRRAYRWRLGKFYYSSMREVELLARLRTEYDLPLRYHVLADVLLRVDFWLGRTLICTYFTNPKYKSKTGGRKPPAARFFAEAQPPFNVQNVEVERGGFGNFWSLSGHSVERVAETLRLGQD